MKHTIQSLKKQGVKFMHFRPVGNDGKPLPNGGTTVAYVRDSHNDRLWFVGYAMCRTATADDARQDTYNHKLGCLISGGRAAHAMAHLGLGQEGGERRLYPGQSVAIVWDDSEDALIQALTSEQRHAGLTRIIRKHK